MTRTYCDKCKNEVVEVFERQEMYTIRFVGGYGSLFGDGMKVTIELCQQCLFDMLTQAGVLNENTMEHRGF